MNKQPLLFLIPLQNGHSTDVGLHLKVEIQTLFPPPQARNNAAERTTRKLLQIQYNWNQIKYNFTFNFDDYNSLKHLQASSDFANVKHDNLETIFL